MRRCFVLSCSALFGACSVAANPPIQPQPMPVADGRPALLVDHPLSDRIASYRIQARLDAQKHEVIATETLTWKHTGNQPVDAVPLHLYLNAFKNETSVFMKESQGAHRQFQRAEDSWGWIDVSSIQMDGQELAHSAGCWPVPRVSPATSDALVDRDRRTSASIGL